MIQVNFFNCQHGFLDELERVVIGSDHVVIACNACPNFVAPFDFTVECGGGYLHIIVLEILVLFFLLVFVVGYDRPWVERQIG